MSSTSERRQSVPLCFLQTEPRSLLGFTLVSIAPIARQPARWFKTTTSTSERRQSVPLCFLKPRRLVYWLYPCVDCMAVSAMVNDVVNSERRQSVPLCFLKSRRLAYWFYPCVDCMAVSAMVNDVVNSERRQSVPLCFLKSRRLAYWFYLASIAQRSARWCKRCRQPTLRGRDHSQDVSDPEAWDRC
jgi:uncharacterized linocin/CFP29 family protein